MNDINKKGFTLVELLAVIVILAVIMIIAIPSVLTIMTSARQKSFSEYVTKVVTTAEKKYLADTMIGVISGSSCYLYDITKSLGLENTRDYKGYILVAKSKTENVNYYISMYNSDFKLFNFDYTKDNKIINDKIETIEDKDTIDNNKIIYELSIISSNCTSVLYNLEGHGYNDTFNYVPDIVDPSLAELNASYLLPGYEFNTALKMLSGNATDTCDGDSECNLFKDPSITKIAKYSATPPERAVVVSTKASKYPTYAWLEGSTIYYKSDAPIYMNSDSSYYFSYFPSVTSIDLSGFNTSTSTNMNAMFYGLESAITLDLSNFDTSNVTSMGGMFEYCESLTSLNLSNFNTSKVTNMSFMFHSCESLTSLDLSSFNTSSLVYFHWAFAEMHKLKHINLSSFDTSKVIYMDVLFKSCEELEELDLSSFETSSVISMSSMFIWMRKLRKLNISNFNTSNVTNMSSMFCDCESLDTIIGFEKITTENVTNMDHMFYSFQSNVTNGYLDLSNFNTSKVTNMSNMFYSFQSNATNGYLNLGSFDTSKVTNMSNMFYSFQSNVINGSLNLSSFDTSKVFNMSNMFNNAFANSKTFTLNLGEHFYTRYVSTMTGMFNRFAYKVPSFTLDLGPNFDTSNVDDMQYMFQSVGRESTGGSANIIFGDKFVFKKGVNTSNMFSYFLQGFPNAEVFLPNMHFSNISKNSNNMFSEWESTKKLYVKTEDDKDWIMRRYKTFTDDNLIIIE